MSEVECIVGYQNKISKTYNYVSMIKEFRENIKNVLIISLIIIISLIQSSCECNTMIYLYGAKETSGAEVFVDGIKMTFMKKLSPESQYSTLGKVRVSCGKHKIEVKLGVDKYFEREVNTREELYIEVLFQK